MADRGRRGRTRPRGAPGSRPGCRPRIPRSFRHRGGARAARKRALLRALRRASCCEDARCRSGRRDQREARCGREEVRAGRCASGRRAAPYARRAGGSSEQPDGDRGVTTLCHLGSFLGALWGAPGSVQGPRRPWAQAPSWCPSSRPWTTPAPRRWPARSTRLRPEPREQPPFRAHGFPATAAAAHRSSPPRSASPPRRSDDSRAAASGSCRASGTGATRGSARALPA